MSKLAAGDSAVLVLHGFTANPRTVAPLGERLEREGIPHSIPRLRGHGGHHRDLRGVRWQDWLDDAREAYGALAAKHPRVAVVGHSVGGTIASMLAAECQPAALVLVAPAIQYAMPTLPLLPLIRLVAREVNAGPPSIADPVLAKAFAQQAINYDRVPVAAFEQTMALQKLVPAVLEKVSCPALVIHARGDKVVKPLSAEIAYARLASRDKRLMWLERSNHEVFYDLERDLICDAIVNFLREVV